MATSLRVFVSATSRDLGSFSERAAKLLRAGCQRHADVRIMAEFGFYDGTIPKKLLREIKECNTVVHLVGKRYGRAPRNEQFQSPPGYPCSYTQLEYWLAKKYKKRVYVILCSDDFPYDPVTKAEGVREQGLQDDHRHYLENDETEILLAEDMRQFENMVHFIGHTLLIGVADEWRRRYNATKLIGICCAVMAGVAVLVVPGIVYPPAYVAQNETQRPQLPAIKPIEAKTIASTNPNGAIGEPKSQPNNKENDAK